MSDLGFYLPVHIVDNIIIWNGMSDKGKTYKWTQNKDVCAG